MKKNNYYIRNGVLILLSMGICMVFLVSLGVGFTYGADPPAVAGATGAEKIRVKNLIEGAKKEGSLLWTSNTIYNEVGEQLNRAFQQRYGLEGLKVTYVQIKSQALIARVSQEIMANRLSIDAAFCDVVSWNYDMLKKGELMKYTSPEDKYYGPAERIGLKSTRVLGCGWSIVDNSLES